MKRQRPSLIPKAAESIFGGLYLRRGTTSKSLPLMTMYANNLTSRLSSRIMVPDAEQVVCTLDFAVDNQPVTLSGYVGDWQLWDIVTDFWRKLLDLVTEGFVC